MNVHAPTARLSLPELLATSTSLFERVHDPLLPGAQGPRDLSVRYVRRKPGHGLAVTYTVYTWPAASQQSTPTGVGCHARRDRRLPGR